ncbi:hypothetical protein GLE_5039 [Lysobacter enzymogenes]|uniref:Uncharacterized protein n=1 Tax=Lysobacter enzymogenes TaxID=69 RepID=A0A0S2DPA6_LYSEN|nr:hypothetical protein GLE_5039 [Lysobacter enzymogenes]
MVYRPRTVPPRMDAQQSRSRSSKVNEDDVGHGMHISYP